MYVVRRAFRNYGQMIVPGSVIEPGTVKRFKSRLNDGHIVEVNEHDFSKWQKYFKERLGVELVRPDAPKASKAPKAPEVKESVKSVKPAAAVVKVH